MLTLLNSYIINHLFVFAIDIVVELAKSDIGARRVSN